METYGLEGRCLWSLFKGCTVQGVPYEDLPGLQVSLPMDLIYTQTEKTGSRCDTHRVR